MKYSRPELHFRLKFILQSQDCHGQEKVLENEKISRSGKSQGISFSVMEI